MKMQLRELMLLAVCSSWLVMLWAGGAKGRTSIELNGALTAADADPLFSAAINPAFMLSFRAYTPSSSSLYLCISFVVHASTPGHCVWTANREAAATRSASLKLTASGNLVLSDTWSSGTSDVPSDTWSSGTSDVVRVLLLDSGNLVLVNRSGSYVWQSFHYPTDTLLPGQDFPSQSALLIGNKRADSPAPGSYSLSLDASQGLTLSNSRLAYWDSGGQIDFFRFDEFGNVTLYNSPSSINATFVANDHGTISAARRMTLDVDGNLRMYTWNAISAVWINVWMAFPDVCNQVGPCGSYGVCVYNPIQPTCMCPQGFSVVVLTDLGSGCKPNSEIDDCTSVKYVEIENIDYPGNDLASTPSLSVEECKNSCTGNCACMVAVYWQSSDAYGTCWLKHIAQNGASRTSQQHRVFLKISASDPLVSNPILNIATQWSSQYLYWQPSTATSGSNQSSSKISYRSNSNKHLTSVSAAVIGVLALCLAGTVAALMICSRRQVKYMKLHKELEGSRPFVCSYEELRVATQNFSQKLGAGGFGSVYKGRLQSGTDVAVKQLEGVSQMQDKQFRAEIMTIGRIHHINLLRLVGFCSEGAHRLLVYEYMERGSLDQVLFGIITEEDQLHEGQTEVLDWTKRFQICLGVARGMHYLHEECLDCILHCDIKPQNILLDASFSPKIADFGLAYLYSRDHKVKASTIRGTRGYLAPEWVCQLPITSKADVFSYGMLILEIVSGRSNYLFSESAMTDASGRWCFPMWAYGKRVDDVIDTRLDQLHSHVDLRQVEAAMEVGFACIQRDMNARPSMGQVVQMLEGTLPIPHAPPPSLFPVAASSSRSSSLHSLSSVDSAGKFTPR